MNPNIVFLLYWPARMLIAALRLGIFDQLARGPQTGEQVAAALGLHPQATDRLLRALVATGWVWQRGETYGNGQHAALSLVTGSPTYVGGSAVHHAEQLWPLWSHLETAVREGRCVVPEAFGQVDPFDLFNQSAERVVEFLDGMHGGAVGFADLVAGAWDFSHYRHLVDVGGGSGAISGPIAQRYPQLEVTLLELAPVAEQLPPFLQRYGVGGRMAVQAGDFFRPETYPADFDIALLGRVLHNWGDDKALQLLRNIAAALPTGGVVLVLEHVTDALDQAGRSFTALSDLNMLVMTGHGRERSASEFEQLFRQAGLTPLAPRPLASSLALLAAVRGG